MILIGQYDSSFVRRVGIALTLYNIPFEHRPWSVFGDAEKIQALNPLMRVPTVVLDDGEVLVDSTSVIDYIEGLVSPEQAMLPREEPARHKVLRVMALATGLADKAVSLFYEQRLHTAISETWAARCRSQMLATLDVLERERSARPDDFWFGERISHADIAVTACLRHAVDSHPDLVPLSKYAALAAHCATFEAMPVFKSISQPFIPPA